MIGCERARDLLLEAEPEALREGAQGDLAEHLAGCAGCAEAARVLVEAEEALGAQLTSPGPSPETVDAILSAAGVDRSETEGSTPVIPFPTWRRMVPVAAAAALAALLLIGPDGELETGLRPLPPGSLPTVEAAESGNLAVIPTDNPNITVLWYF